MFNRNAAWIAVLAMALATMGGLEAVRIRAAAMHGPLPPSAPPISVEDGDIVYGSPNARETVLVLVSMTCPHCRRWEEEEMPSVLRRLVATGRVRLVVRDFPLNQPSMAAAALVRCMPGENRAAAHAALIAHMPDWTDFPAARMAETAGLAAGDAGKALACAARPDVRDAIRGKAETVMNVYGAKATPSFIIGGQIITGAIPEAEFEALLKYSPNAGG